MYPLSPELVESPPSEDTPSSRQWVLVGVADSSQLGTPERTRQLEMLQQRSIEHGMTIATNYRTGNYAHA